MSTKVGHHEWIIRSSPERKGHHWHSWVAAERPSFEATNDDEIFTFSDIGYFDTGGAAHDRGMAWARTWLDANF